MADVTVSKCSTRFFVDTTFFPGNFLSDILSADFFEIISYVVLLNYKLFSVYPCHVYMTLCFEKINLLMHLKNNSSQTVLA